MQSEQTATGLLFSTVIDSQTSNTDVGTIISRKRYPTEDFQPKLLSQNLPFAVRKNYNFPLPGS
jgi:hypothetical protein